MDDKELLELAAKAAGIVPLTNDGKCITAIAPAGNEYIWNPLNSDGDALRLAVKLRIEPKFLRDVVQGIVLAGSDIGDWETVLSEIEIKDDPYAATRRAIVRAAAEIGKLMK